MLPFHLGNCRRLVTFEHAPWRRPIVRLMRPQDPQRRAEALRRVLPRRRAIGEHAAPALKFLSALAVLACLVVSGCASPRAVHTPVATPATVQGRLDLIARQALGGAVHELTATYDAQSEALELTATLVGGVPRTAADISAAQEHVKLLCFRAQRAEWTSGNPLRSMTVTILGPTLDDYADLTSGPYGAAVLTSATAAALVWGSLSADGAWERYDHVWLAATYAPNQHYGAPPAATASPTR